MGMMPFRGMQVLYKCTISSVDRDALESELNVVKAQLSAATRRNIELEEECDLLAEHNQRLQEEIKQLRIDLAVAKSSLSTDTSSATASASSVDVLPEQKQSFGEVFLESHDLHATTLIRNIPNASSGKNVIVVAFFAANGNGEESQDFLFCGGVDAHLRCYSTATGEEICNLKVTAPVLCIDCAPPLVACGMMDGSVVCCTLNTQSKQLEGKQTFSNHSKYVIGVKWSSTGEYLATAAHDRSFSVYRRGDFQQLTKITGGELEHLPESLSFLPTNNGAEIRLDLVLGLRGVSYLLYLTIPSLQRREVSLNERDWDTTASLTPLALVPSQDGRHLLVATDKSVMFLFRAGTSQRLRVLAGHTCGDYGKPSVSFDAGGGWVYCNSDEDSAVLVFSVAAQKVVARLQGHRGIVRGVAAHPFKKGVVASASYDKSVIIWGPAAECG